jgi:hypothetical protein
MARMKRMRKTAATRTTTASRPLLESQTTISHAELAALPDANPRGARRSNPGAELYVASRVPSMRVRAMLASI